MKEKYQTWLEKCKKEKELYDELISIEGNEAEISDRFYRGLEFGTGGLRGTIGAGTNRMNIYTVGRATFGFGKYLKEKWKNPSVAIAYDSRYKSREFAFSTASILSSMGIKAYVFNELTPTPVLSYAVRALKACGGIVITASHNPKEYNGYKVYNEKGCQITDEAAKEITNAIEGVEYFEPYIPNDALINILNDEIFEQFLNEIQKLSLRKVEKQFLPKIVYTPLHGTGRRYVLEILNRIGVSDVVLVKEQEMPDSAFTTCPYPNPEEREAMNLALQYAKDCDADMFFATDPDADRIGIAVKETVGKYRFLNGNETGILLMDYMLSAKAESGTLGQDATVIKTIVTTDMAFEVAKNYGVQVSEVLTGFKYIGEKMDETDHFVMGMEESYGYLVGKHARDKDAVSAAMLIVEMCAYYKAQGKTLAEVLDGLYSKYGYYKTELISIKYPGEKGMNDMRFIMNGIRNNPLKTLLSKDVEYSDFLQGVNNLPKSNVLRFRNESVNVIFRPSGTEPKLKIYLQVKTKDEALLNQTMSSLKKELDWIINV
jgi:phosphoglucomutase